MQHETQKAPAKPDYNFSNSWIDVPFFIMHPDYISYLDPNYVEAGIQQGKYLDRYVKYYRKVHLSELEYNDFELLFELLRQFEKYYGHMGRSLAKTAYNLWALYEWVRDHYYNHGHVLEELFSKFSYYEWGGFYELLKKANNPYADHLYDNITYFYNIYKPKSNENSN